MRGSDASCLVAVLWVLAGSTWATDGGLLNGDLGHWLESTVAPELGEVLVRHPRFKGETLSLTALGPGAPERESNRLGLAMEQRLRAWLLKSEGVRLIVERPERGCAPPQPIGYLIRIEVVPTGGRSGRVHIAVVDVAESVWVSGISYQWRGRLSAAERAALDVPVSRAGPGSAGNPIPVGDARQIAAAMKADLHCMLPHGLDGALYLTTPTQPVLARVGLELQAELSYESLAALTPDRDQAQWLLTLEAQQADADVRELHLTLTDASGASRQRVASVFVSGSPGRDSAAGGPAVAGVAAPVPGGQASAASPALLSSLQLSSVPSEGICDARRARVNSCAEIAFELRAPAYLLVFSTLDHHVAEVPCRSPQRARPGIRRYRIRVPPGEFAIQAAQAGPDAGLYVLASRDRAVAARVQRALADAPGHCRNPAAGSSSSWLNALQEILADAGRQLEWRVMHLVHDTAGIVAL